ncbi:MAG: NlpC/P60 family protein [Clostridium sp.]|uniref:C40 family peptidase n=1 Tax=Clostridium sp. TaxID=1506 RepID=UPI00304FDA90
MNKKSISLVLALAMGITCIGTNALADPYNDKSTYEQKLQENKNSYKTAQEQVDEIEASIQSVNSQMEDITVDIEKLNVDILEVEGRIEKSNNKVQATESDIKEENDLYSKRMRSMYMNGMDSYIEVLLNSKGLSDFVSRLNNVTKIINYDKEIISSLMDKKQLLVSEKKIIEDEKGKLDAFQDENNKKLAQLEEKKSEHSAAMELASSNRDLFEAAMKESEDQLAETIRQINSLTQNTDRPNRGDETTGINPPGSGSSSSIVSYAMNFLGVPYQWGGNGPNTFDCSGFTKYVYAGCGISLSRTAQDQMNGGSPVSRDQLQRGDLVFFGSGGYAYHVGIYVGNNSYIHAPQDNEVVKISPMSRQDYIGGRRY